MKWTKKSVAALVAILVMTAAVLILAILQYRWTGEIGRTEQQRLEAELKTSVRNFDQEFSYDFERMSESFPSDPDAPESTLESRVAQQYLNWEKTSTHPGLIAGVHIWKTDYAAESYFESFDQNSKRFQRIAWPAKLALLQRFLQPQVGYVAPMANDQEAVYYPWTFYEGQPALIRPILQMSAHASDSRAPVQSVGFLLVELNADYLEKQYFPDLVERHFGVDEARAFGVSVRSAEPPYQTVYISDAKFPISPASPDAAVNLFDSANAEAKRRGYAPLETSSDARQWQLVAQHRAGSLEDTVAALRRRNLAISLGLLSILAACMVLIFAVARRDEQLAKLRMEFVAGMSHELCTPLAIINSAAENLVDGVVDSPEQIGEYGGLIRDQGRRLERLVDEILLFAAGRFGSAGYELQPVEIACIVTQSLADSESMLSDAGFDVEKEIGAGLPLVAANPAAVTTCMENLISNAMKYASANRRLAVRVRAASANPHSEVQISVEDKGIGISSVDLSNIFEPFYRVPAVRDSQIRGVGLGLYLVKRMMEGMGGRVSVASEPGLGTSFVLHFPVANSNGSEWSTRPEKK